MMRALPAAATILFISSVAAFWDAGHMLVGEVAVQYMDPEDVVVLQSLLAKWEDDFPNTGEIATATQWADIIKCDKSVSYCPSPLLPSIRALNKYHYVGLNIKLPEKDNITAVDLFQAAEGDAHTVMEDTFKVFQTTRSIWSANFMLRFFLHTFGDIHQPLHTTNGQTAAFPDGDQGGNKFRFEKPCAFFNLHAMWDATAGLYSHAWNMTMDQTRKRLRDDAVAIRKQNLVFDKVGFAETKDMSYAEFSMWLKQTNAIRKVIMESYEMARESVYAPLNLTLSATGHVECPSEDYVLAARDTIKQQLHLGGYRLAFVLKQLAHQTRALNLI